MIFRKELIGIKRIVVKVGSNVITKKNGKIDSRKVRQIVEDISELIYNNIEVVLVSSGAVSLGKFFLKDHIPRDGKIDLLHSASSIGQPKLINTYSRLFEENGNICSQILLTHDDFRDRKRFLHTKQNIHVLLKNKITPILNENDSISYTEITVGDNDHLAAQTAQMINADLLIVITSTDGVFTKDPSQVGAKKIESISTEQDIEQLCFQGKTLTGRGGMESKVRAILKITQLGIKAIISSKDNQRLIIDPLTKKIGTYFAPRQEYDPEQRKAWLLSTKKSNCSIEVDRGAYRALQNCKSLLPKGIIAVEGNFFQGDCIDIKYDGVAFASGVCEYDNMNIEQIMGMHSDEIESVLGFKTSCEVIHTGNLIIEKDIQHESVS